jgi:8-oxo-dGTP pyrophosphatase MutT (NUDIX family)
LLTRRAEHLSQHAGQISFPGGRVDPLDRDITSAALRETEEEIGLSRTRIALAGFLPDHLIISGYRVTPVVGFIQPGFDLQLDPAEVAEVFEMPLRHLLDERNHVRRSRHFQGAEVELTDVPFGPHHIWGATAGMLLTLYRVLRGEDR